MKLQIELIPKSSWYKNVRSSVSRKEWDMIRTKCYEKVHYKCEICGGKGLIHPVECHEVWEFNEKEHIQKLVGLIALCPLCHKVKHFGLAQLKGEEKLAIKQLMKVNTINKDQALQHINEAQKLWEERSKYDWFLDLSYLQTFLNT